MVHIKSAWTYRSKCVSLILQNSNFFLESPRQKLSDMEIWKYGNMEIWKYGKVMMISNDEEAKKILNHHRGTMKKRENAIDITSL